MVVMVGHRVERDCYPGAVASTSIPFAFRLVAPDGTIVRRWTNIRGGWGR